MNEEEFTKIRRELKCDNCCKTRMLSIEEATEDGWVMHTKMGLICCDCAPKYGIPSTFLRSPTFIGLGETEDGNIARVIEFRKEVG